jgi:hypothetical protein
MISYLRQKSILILPILLIIVLIFFYFKQSREKNFEDRDLQSMQFVLNNKKFLINKLFKKLSLI